MLRKIILISLPCLLAAGVLYAQGTWVDTSFVPPSLGFDNGLIVYLPEGYDPGGTIDYPVIYYLHGWYGNQYEGQSIMTIVMDSLISNGLIAPALVVQPNGNCPPYGGSMWANSELYGNYEDYVATDLIAFVDSSFCTIPDRLYRSIGGGSMGGTGSMDLVLRHLDLYNAVVSASGVMDHQTFMPLFIPSVIQECPESEPPYTYDWGNGNCTNAYFLMCGGYSPHMGNPYDIDFLLDPNGEVIDSVYALIELHNPAHMVKFLSIPSDFGLYFDCGDQDPWPGFYESNEGYSDTLTSLGVTHTFISWPGLGHVMTIERQATMVQFVSDYMTGVSGSQTTPEVCRLLPPAPNPFTTITTLVFAIPEAGNVSIQVFDISGRLVKTLVDSWLPAGESSVNLEAEGFSSGVYIAVLRAGNETSFQRCVLVR